MNKNNKNNYKINLNIQEPRMMRTILNWWLLIDRGIRYFFNVNMNLIYLELLY
jgi:hypothetical protein